MNAGKSDEHPACTISKENKGADGKYAQVKIGAGMYSSKGIGCYVKNGKTSQNNTAESDGFILMGTSKNPTFCVRIKNFSPGNNTFYF